jgi:hypothetical protein
MYLSTAVFSPDIHQRITDLNFDNAFLLQKLLLNFLSIRQFFNSLAFVRSTSKPRKHKTQIIKKNSFIVIKLRCCFNFVLSVDFYNFMFSSSLFLTIAG